MAVPVEVRAAETATQLKEQVLGLVNDLVEICPNDMDIMLIRVFLTTAVLPVQLMDSFIEFVFPWRRAIRNRDDKFFKENINIFGMLPADKVAHFKELWESDHFGDEDRDVIWDYFNVYIDLTERYIGLTTE